MDLLIECNVELCKSQCQPCNQQQVSLDVEFIAMSEILRSSIYLSHLCPPPPRYRIFQIGELLCFPNTYLPSFNLKRIVHNIFVYFPKKHDHDI